MSINNKVYFDMNSNNTFNDFDWGWYKKKPHLDTMWTRPWPTIGSPQPRVTVSDRGEKNESDR